MEKEEEDCDNEGHYLIKTLFNVKDFKREKKRLINWTAQTVSYTSILDGWREEDRLMFSELETVRKKTTIFLLPVFYVS